VTQGHGKQAKRSERLGGIDHVSVLVERRSTLPAAASKVLRQDQETASNQGKVAASECDLPGNEEKEMQENNQVIPDVSKQSQGEDPLKARSRGIIVSGDHPID